LAGLKFVLGVNMIRDTASNRIAKLLIGWSLILISVALAFNAFLASRAIDADSQELLGSNFYISSKELRNRRLISQLESQSRGLEFMVWEQERSDLSKDLSELLWQRINLDPYHGANWVRLIYLQKEAGASIGERAWTLERAATLLKWNIEDRMRISYYCFSEYSDFITLIPDICSPLILNLPSQWSEKNAAERIKVPLEVLRSVLAREHTRAGSRRSQGPSIQ
jgi:hypothetical protein